MIRALRSAALVASLAVGLFGSAAEAASYTANFLGDSRCPDRLTSNDPVINECQRSIFGFDDVTVLSRGEARPGSVSALATSFRGILPNGVEVGESMRAQASFSDELTFAVSTGSLILELDLLSETVNLGIGSGSASVEFVVRADRETFSMVNELGDGRTRSVHEVVFPFSTRLLRLGAIITARATCLSVEGSAVDDAACMIRADASNSLRIIGATVQDSDGNTVENGILSSSSGFDYATGLSPHVVPLPGALAFLVAGLGGLGLLRRRAA